MKIDTILITNFRPYFGAVSVNFKTELGKNIILIGGKNGYGKTNFLLSLVWCLYGERISKIDDNFRREIQKESSYPKFMQQSLNWSAKDAGESIFSVEVLISDVMGDSNFIRIKRTYNVQTCVEQLSILNDNGNELFLEKEDNEFFIQSHVIPIEAAKFVFFDAEKIAIMAELSTKEEGAVLNDALSKILGLDIYLETIEQIEIYISTLRRNNANANLSEQITNNDQSIELANNAIAESEELILNLNKVVTEIKSKIKDIDSFILEYSKVNTTPLDRESIERKIIQEKQNIDTSLGKVFNESEIIPLLMLNNSISSVLKHLEVQTQIHAAEVTNSLYSERMEVLIQKLFFELPEPEGIPLTISQKLFYTEKAQNLVQHLLKDNQTNTKYFDLDYSKFERELITASANISSLQGNESFLDLIRIYQKSKNEIYSLERQISIADGNNQDPIFHDYLSQKESLEIIWSKKIEEIGKASSIIQAKQKEIERLNIKKIDLLKKIKVSEIAKDKINISEQYISTLNQYLTESKKQKKENLEFNILNELQNLMHKFETHNHFIKEVSVSILPNNEGFKVTLFDNSLKEIPKNVLSQGEKQLYISSLIKSILKESYIDFPIFIDTPLGRLDNEHIKNVLLNFYPNLANQVVILSTNNEITPTRFNELSPYIAQSYVIENNQNKSNIKSGYFTK